MDSVLAQLKKYFGHSQFRSETQEKAIKAILKRNQDVYVSMPTGSGKSMCFQLPAVLQKNKVAIVFSPLISLMKDREMFFGLIKDSLHKKVSVAFPKDVSKNVSKDDCEACAVELEYRSLVSTVVSLYRRAVMKTVTEIKNWTKDSKLCESLLEYKGKGKPKRDTLDGYVQRNPLLTYRKQISKRRPPC